MKKVFAIAYVLVSLIMSGIVSTDKEFRADIIENRSPYMLIEVCVSTVENYELTSDGLVHISGYDWIGGYIGYGYDTEKYKIGDKVVSLMFYNPFNNYIDDIALRFDF